LPYALVPDGYKLRKVTKLQQEAISAKRSHDDVVALLSNPNTPLVAGAAVATFFLVNFADDIINKIKATGAVVSDEVEKAIKNVIDEQKKKIIPDFSLGSIESRLRDLGFSPKGLA